MTDKYMVIDPCYIGDNELVKRYGSPIAIYHTGDGVFGFEGQNVSVDSGIIHIYKVSENENLLLQGDLSQNPFAEIAYLNQCPTQEEVNQAIEYYDKYYELENWIDNI